MVRRESVIADMTYARKTPVPAPPSASRRLAPPAAAGSCVGRRCGVVVASSWRRRKKGAGAPRGRIPASMYTNELRPDRTLLAPLRPHKLGADAAPHIETPIETSAARVRMYLLV